jgi:hypothetical protein
MEVFLMPLLGLLTNNRSLQRSDFDYSPFTIAHSPIPSFKFIAFASTAGGLRNRNAAAFASF